MKKFFGGLAFKTFVFSLVLMTMIMVMTLGILYAFLPGYYLAHMTNQLDRNASDFIQEINRITEIEDTLLHIVEFSTANNVRVTSFDEMGQPLFNLSRHPVAYQTFSINGGRMIHVNDIGGGFQIFNPTIISTPPRHIDNWTMVFRDGNYVPDDTFRAAHVTIASRTGDFVISDSEHSVGFVRTVTHPLINHMEFTSTLQPIDQAQDVIVAMIPYLMVAGFIIALAMAFIFSRLLTKPIIKIADAAEQMRQMKPDVVSGITTNDEVGRLSRTMDKLYLDLCANIQNLQTEMARTAELERSKTDLMRAAGHELKTPIAALSGMLDGMIDKVGVYKNHEKYLPELKAQTERLSKLVHEILMASKTEETTNQLEPALIDMNALMEETITQYLPLIEKKDLQLNMSIFSSLSSNMPSENFMYETDKRVLSIALSNILSNAVKYTPDGGDVRIGMATYQRGRVLFIENQCEVDKALVPSQWFEPFYTPDYSRNKSKSGTGLGLYIVKKNLDALDLPYEIALVDDGIRFEITFPIFT
ncbi:MAG: HAMP domain-containing histidine kinase [Defluviitaleaceae bacterium]|nr:HAMP domain-containing histidine kinase [Defluviitaleaceae bacterium]